MTYVCCVSVLTAVRATSLDSIAESSSSQGGGASGATVKAPRSAPHERRQVAICINIDEFCV